MIAAGELFSMKRVQLTWDVNCDWTRNEAMTAALITILTNQN